MRGQRGIVLRHLNCASALGVVSVPRSIAVGLRLWPVGMALSRYTRRLVRWLHSRVRLGLVLRSRLSN